MPLSWNEIKHRAIEFSNNWSKGNSERSEAQTFWNEFFYVFGIMRRRVAVFESPVKKINNNTGFIDLFWKGVLVAEHKSKGEKLDKAYDQALDYFYGLKEYELPKYVIVCNFEKLRLYDIEKNTAVEFLICDFHKNIHNFDFIAGYKRKEYKDEEPVNIKAAELMAKLYDRLEKSGFAGHQLELFLVRIVFCLFADDTGLFDKGIFTSYIENRTKEDGSDIGLHLANIFQTLNTPHFKRQKSLDEDLTGFPYVNGKLFEEQLYLAAFDSEMRGLLLEACYFDWNLISPAVFGSLFQGVMDKEKRRNIGAHYTSEKNILKLIKSLFLDDLYNEFNTLKNSKEKVIAFHQKISKLTFFDPACGCGNFLVITYRELRILEIEILKILLGNTQTIDLSIYTKVDVNQMFGIEIEEFPARVAEIAIWMTEHQMNVKLSEEFGLYFVKLPLTKVSNITIGNSLTYNWEKIIDKEKLNYILGNPPFIGKQHRTQSQNEDMKIIFKNINGAGVLDYVCCWYLKTAKFINDTKIKAAFVSTNSISQGEQVGILWNELFKKYKVKIHFAHRTFKWNNEARGKASVYVVIIGFANFDVENKFLYDYETPDAAEPLEYKAQNINPYLTFGNDIIVIKKYKPICDVPEIVFGNMPNDGGYLLLSEDEKIELLKNEPLAKEVIKPLISAREYLNNIKRYCIWLKDVDPKLLSKLKYILERIEKVKKIRMQSERKTTNKLAEYPALFGEIRQPESSYILIPRHTSENRKYIPFGFFKKDDIVHDSCMFIADTNLYHLGILSSEMHMIWIKYTCGKLEGRFRYSAEIVYNNFIWPDKPKKIHVDNVKNCIKKIIELRIKYKKTPLKDLYSPLIMPHELVKAHKFLDRAVDLCYRGQPFSTELQRVEFLFEIYDKYSMPLLIKN